MAVIDLFKKGDVGVGDERWMVTCPKHNKVWWTGTRQRARWYNKHKRFFCVECKHEHEDQMYRNYVRKEGHL